MKLFEHSVALPEGVLVPDPEYVEFIKRPDTCVSQMIIAAMEVYADRPALAWRPIRGGVLAKDYVTMTYAELWEQVRAFASFVAHDERMKMKTGDLFCTLAFGSREFVVIDLALAHNGVAIVPLQTTATSEQTTGIVGEVMPPCIAASVENLDNAVTAAIATPETRCVVVFDIDAENPTVVETIERQRQRLAETGGRCVLVTFDEALQAGSKLPPAEPFIHGPDVDPMVLVYYTSGSTGTPKGAMYSERLTKSAWQLVRDHSTIVVHYQPLNHSFGKSYISMAIASGGTTYFTAKSDLSTLLEDIAAVRPTAMAMVPRVSELIYQRFRAEYGKVRGEEEDAAIAEFKRTALGGRLIDAVSGAAPASPEILAFLCKLMGRQVPDAYGATEVGGVSVNGRILNPPVIDYKLLDVPELGYYTTDTPHPRGELAVKSLTRFMGYFKRPELTAQVFDEDGFYKTGDIFAEIEPGRIQYLDRRNNVLKLAQGEFVAVANLESLYAGSDGRIAQIFIHGNSSRSYLLAVVVPNPGVLPPTMEEAAVKAEVLAALREVAAKAGLHSYEVPRDVIIEREPFSTENGLLAGVGKPLRQAMRAKYAERLEAMYETMAHQQDEELAALRSGGADAPAVETVCRAARTVLGLEQGAVTADQSFADLGGDSLSALSFSLLLEDVYGVPVDVGMIMHPTGTLAQLAKSIEGLRSGEGVRADPMQVHGGNLDVLRASDLTIDKFLDPSVLADAGNLAPPADAEPDVVLLTGANGFLGRFLCVEWLKRMERNGKGRLICIGRGADDASARARLLESFAGGDGRMASDVQRLGEGRLEVLAGDLAQPRLGLAVDRWAELARDVDLIVHSGALVNHKLPYRQLFGPNVAGTAELIALALTTKMKRFVHVSTIAAAATAAANEDADVRVAVPEWRVSDGYADGYGASKWAAEVLLADAHERFGLPVGVYRSNMILAPLGYNGQLNVPDMFTRLILSLALTRLAPESFYAGDAARAHYEGLPADFIAQAIIGIGEHQRSGLRTYHVMNPNDDGVSLDSFVDWIGDEGYTIKRVAPHDEWVRRFEGLLRGLPEDQRNASILPLMESISRPYPVYLSKAPRFAEAVRAAQVTDDGGIPHLGRAMIAQYLADLRALDMLPEAVAVA